MCAPRPKSAGDPSNERSRQVILQVVLDELSAVGYGALTIESIARRARVGNATIYRHWSGKIALIADASKLLPDQRDPDLVIGSPREKRPDRLSRLVVRLSSREWRGIVQCGGLGRVQMKRDRPGDTFAMTISPFARRPLPP
jgi:AcrR family transcriptional regulator